MGPLSHLARHAMPELEFVPMADGRPDWSTFFNVDVLFLQRPHTPGALEWMHAAAEARVPVWLDYDDDLDNVPPEHVSYWAFKKTKAVLAEILNLAEVVTVSTPALAASIADRTARPPVVIPNAIDETMMPVAPARELDPNFLAWRGGPTHREDIELARHLFTRDDIAVHYFGQLPPWVRSGRDIGSPWKSFPVYHAQLSKSLAGCLVVPLLNNTFNRAKSNCSWLEATWAGLAVTHLTSTPPLLSSPLPEFNRPGILSEAELAEATPEGLAEARDESLSCILDHLTLESVNLLRAELLRSL